jgi:N6-adenosine-specific RNA methylase IME4
MKQDILVQPRGGFDLPGKLTKISWDPPEDMPFEQWKACMVALAEVGGSVAWALGEGWRYGERTYGARVKALREGIFGSYSFQTVANFGWVCGKIATSVRTEVLEFGHHDRVAKLPPDEQKLWLDRAAKGNKGKRWSIQELRRKLFEAKLRARHRAIADGDLSPDLSTATFPLIYADPPWKFDTYSLLGKEWTSAELHYPTMDAEAVAEFKICGRPVREVADKDAGLFLWCTSSNIQLALETMLVWGFSYKTQAVWDKQRTGTGYVFLNQHEILLYGSRGEFPMPLKKVSSVFRYQRGKHSAKPPQVRAALEKMYPRMNEGDRLELFARGKVPGWTTWGNEARQ